MNYRCTGFCRRLLDEDEFRPHLVNGELVCPDCVEVCAVCEEHLDDKHECVQEAA